MSPPPKYGIVRIAHARGSQIQWIPDTALFTAQRLSRIRGRRARCGAQPRQNLASQLSSDGCGARRSELALMRSEYSSMFAL